MEEVTRVFRSSATGNYPTLFNPQTGRLDAARIAREFNVPVVIISEAIGRKAPGVRKSPDASSSRMVILARLSSL
jgi:hypothetical protein